MLHLAAAYSTDLEGISAVYTSRSAGYLIGALFGCLLFRYLNRELCLSVMYFLIAAALLVVALIQNLTVAVIILGIQGFCTGVCDSATNVIICQTWKQKASPFIQALYFFFGLGNTIAPLMVAPFLTSGRFRIPFYITCSVLVLAGAVHLPLAFVQPLSQDEEQVDDDGVPDEQQPSPRRENDDKLKRMMEWCAQRENYSVAIIVVLLTIVITAYSGVEIIYWEFISAYLLKIPHLTILPEKAAYMTAAVNYFFTLMRGLAIFFAAKVKPQIMINVNLLILMIACDLLLYSDSMTTVWIGNLLIGAAFSTIYPQIYAYAVSQITITNYIGSLFVFASGATALFYPKVVAREIERNHNFLIWIVLINIAVAFATFIALIILAKFFKSRRMLDTAYDGYKLPPCSSNL